MPTDHIVLPKSYELCFSPDGERIASVGTTVAMTSTHSGELLWQSRALSHPSYMRFDAAGRQLAVKNTAGRIAVLDTADGMTLADFRNARNGEGAEVSFSPCGEFVADASWKGVIRVRQAQSGLVTFQRSFGDEMIRAFQPDGSRTLWLSDHYIRHDAGQPASAPHHYYLLWRWPFDDHPPRQFALGEISALQSAISPDGERVAVLVHDRAGRAGHVDCRLEIHSIPGGRLLAVAEGLEIGGTGYALTWSPDAALLGSIQRDRFVIYRSDDLSQVAAFDSDYPSHIAFSPCRRWFALGDWHKGRVLPMSLLAA